MIPAIMMRVGTRSPKSYWIYGKKQLRSLKVGDRIKFKPQLVRGAKWEKGIIREIKIDMPVVERF